MDDAEREDHTREWGLPPGDLAAYVHALWDKATTPNDVPGSKLMWNNFDWLRSSPRPPAGTDPGLETMRTTFPNAQFIWPRRADKRGKASRGGERSRPISRPCGQARSPGSQRPTWSRSCSSSSPRSGARTAGGSGSHQRESSPCQVVYEDLARDRLAAANAALEFLRLPQLDADDLPPIRYRKQADTLTERYAALVRSAMSSRSTRDP